MTDSKLLYIIIFLSENLYKLICIFYYMYTLIEKSNKPSNFIFNIFSIHYWF